MSQFPTQNYAGPNVQGGGSNGLGIAALICGIAALVTCWIPCINIIAIPLALVALGLGIAGWITSGKKGQSPTTSIMGTVLGVVAFIGFFVSYMVFGAVMENVGNSAYTQIASSEAARLEQEALGQGAAQADVDAAMDKWDAEFDRAKDMEIGQKIQVLNTAMEALQRDLNAIEGVDVEASDIDPENPFEQ